MEFLLSRRCSSTTISVFCHDPTRTLLHTACTLLLLLFVLDQQIVLWYDCGMVGNPTQRKDTTTVKSEAVAQKEKLSKDSSE